VVLKTTSIEYLEVNSLENWCSNVWFLTPSGSERLDPYELLAFLLVKKRPSCQSKFDEK